MKKQSSSRTKRLFLQIFKVRSWSDWERTHSFFLVIKTMFNHLFILESPKKSSVTFQSAMERYNLTEEQLSLQARALRRLYLLMLLALFIVFLYVGYQLVYGTYVGLLLSLVVWMIALALAFRYNYWLFIIQRRTLGVSLTDWFKYSILRKKT